MNELPSILIGKGDEERHLLLKMANRHGLISGATGTGKTVTLQILAEGFSKAGVPVFLADVKGDLSGLACAGKPHPKIDERIETIGISDYFQEGFPVTFWDLFGKQGYPIRTTISDMGPLLLARLLDLNETQEGVLNVGFQVADDQGWLLLDLKDLHALLNWMGENTGALTLQYGNVSKASIGAIQRRLLGLKQQGGSKFFGEPALKLTDFLSLDEEGRGRINLLAASSLMQSPKLYATFLLWLLSELFETLPEVGDPEKPILVFFFDEAHLLFDDAPKSLVDKVELVARLIRSKGVGVYFVSQSPLDVPEDILGQLGNRVQHALRAFTPKDQKTVNAAAQTFRPNPKFDTKDAITEMGVGVALVSTLDAKGRPSIVERCLIRPPASRMGPATAAERKEAIAANPLAGQYEKALDRRSAFEILTERAEAEAEEAEVARNRKSRERYEDPTGRVPKKTPASKSTRSRQTVFEAAAKSVVRSIGTTIGRELVRGILGSFLKRR
jgi:DNA helicase HerA-like ATPase